MVFSSPIFIFGFLPFALFIYFLSPRAIKNLTLLFLSLLFYSWGEVFYVAIMLTSIILNYLSGLMIYASSASQSKSRLFLFLGVSANLILLISFKYANFLTDNVNEGLEKFSIAPFELDPVHLPLGISFFTFQAISYIVDVYRKQVPAQRNLFNLALYISLFPQLIAGPIVRYKDVADQILTRVHSLDLFSNGVRRFVYGLAKKVLIANALGQVADNIFIMTNNDLTLPLAWLGVIAYALQIYFDFSGYSDMAIGLGMMFGFKFLENFNYPYISRSIQEFWRRWHISLSTWFRDYVYISMGGNRVSSGRVYLNLLIVFILTGFWHGASWNFLIWGLFHGLFLILERQGLNRVLTTVWSPLSHFYVLFVVLISWVFFRSETLSDSLVYLSVMFDPTSVATSKLQFASILSNEVIYAFAAGILLSAPVFPKIKATLQSRLSSDQYVARARFQALEIVLLVSLLGLSILKISASTYNPFIYFRF